MNKTKNRALALSAVLACALTAQGQKVDFDLGQRKLSEVNTPGYASWSVPQAASDVKSIGGVTLTISASGKSDVLRSQWNKNDVKQAGLLLTGDAVVAYASKEGNTPNVIDRPMQITVTITGLSAGRHTLQAYHNGVNGYENLAPLHVRVDGKMVLRGVKQSANAQTLEAAGTSYVSFEARRNRPVVITFTSDPGRGSYGSSLVYLNALVLDEPDVKAMAQSPVPASGDYHFDADGGMAELRWMPGASAVRHHVYLGTSADNLREVAVTTAESRYAATGLSCLNTYHWRVDEEDAQGNVTRGKVWTFRPRHLAFPGAEGYGRYAIGGRGGSVYHVTTLEDNGDDAHPIPGSLRYGIKQVKGPRTIVFDVGGVISLKSRLTCADPYVTVAGQTAPGQGIMLRTSPFGMASDGITRFVRMRLGHKKLVDGLIPGARNGKSYGSEANTSEETLLSGQDGMGMAGNNHSIMDHCSISWTIDEAFSSRGAQNITLQRTLISEALNIAGHPNYAAGKGHGYAGTIGGGEMTSELSVGSYHHNLLAHCEGRNWSVSGGLNGTGSYDGHHDIFNNVVYNWETRATDGGSHEINFVNNFYKKGPATRQPLLFRLQLEGTGSGTQSAYVDGNIRQETDGSLTEDREGETYRYEAWGGQKVDWTPLVHTPFFESQARIETARAAYKNVLSDVGCNMPLLDVHDTRMVNETLAGSTSTRGSRSGTAGIIDAETDEGCEGFDGLGILPSARPEGFDTDGDGMPDWWERAHALSVTTPDNNGDPDGDGYTHLEDYLNWMAEPHCTVARGEKVELDLTRYFAGYASQPRFEVEAKRSLGLSGKADKALGEAESLLTMTRPDATHLVLAAKDGRTGFVDIVVTASDADGWGTLTRTIRLYFE